MNRRVLYERSIPKIDSENPKFKLGIIFKSKEEINEMLHTTGLEWKGL